MKQRERIHISLDLDVLAAIDLDRGRLTRSDYINDILFYATVSNEQLRE